MTTLTTGVTSDIVQNGEDESEDQGVMEYIPETLEPAHVTTLKQTVKDVLGCDYR